MDLASGQVITSGCVTEMRISNAITEAVEKMGNNQGFKNGLKIANCSEINFLENDWIAGVDENYKNDENNESEIKHENQDETKMKK